ncbi:MAG TPA: hypothetical protein VJN43_06920 [Bryobacteraceae bacterium]|nr:hypothetical protein [Bryobacteraceae bacterium]
MPEDVFRWVVTIAVILAALAMILQAALVFAMYRVTKATQEKIGPVIDAALPAVSGLRRFLDENIPKFSRMMSDSAEMTKALREQVNRLSEVVKDVSDRARAQVARIDGVVDQAVDELGAASGVVRNAITKPAKQVDGIMHGIRAALSVYAHGRRESVDHATQDEEMFI